MATFTCHIKAYTPANWPDFLQCSSSARVNTNCSCRRGLTVPIHGSVSKELGTNFPGKVTKSGVIHLGISDHSLVFLTCKAHYDRNGPRTIETWQFKHFDKNRFLSDLNQMPWAHVDVHSDPNDMCCEWKEMFLSCVDKHAPLKSRRVRKKQCPWITGDLLCKTRRRDFLNKKAISSNNSAAWDQYKRARNRANNAIKLAKKIYFFYNLEANKENLRKTWNLNNQQPTLPLSK